MKVQVTLNDDLVKKIDELSTLIGASRSSLCSIFIYHGLHNYLNIDVVNSSDNWVKRELDKI